MPDPNTELATSHVVFANITASPTSRSWSQSYHAGKLFALITLTKTPDFDSDETLSAIGKKLLGLLEDEYFTKEAKNFESIKQAVSTTAQEIPRELSMFFAAGAIVSLDDRDILYVFSQGDGSVYLKRSEAFAPVLKNSKELEGVSGFLEDLDCIVIQSNAFEEVIDIKTLARAIEETPILELAETIAPSVLKKEEGAAAALILSYTASKPSVKQDSETAQTDSSHTNYPSYTHQFPPRNKAQLFHFKKFPKDLLSHFSQKLPTISLPRLSFLQKLSLGVAAVVLVMLVVGIMLSIQNKNSQKTQEEARIILAAAMKKYDEGVALISLNKTLAREDLLSAQTILQDGLKKFPKDSKEYTDIETELKKVETRLTEAASVNSVPTTEVDASKSPLLAYEFKNTKTQYIAADSKSVYLLDADGVTAIDKTSQKSKQIIKASEWSSAGGLGTYLGNIYVLDKSANQIFKFVSSDGVFGKSNYFLSNSAPTLSKAASIAIDGSIYIVFEDGALAKFTRGKSDTFKLSNLDKPLNKPTRIFTNADTDNLYILDNGNSRIVVLSKEGGYLSQYQTSVLKTAKDFEILEKDKKIYILSGDKIFEIAFK